MADTDVSVQIGADASGVAAGISEAGDAVAALGAQVSQIAELIRAQTEAITEGFAEMAEVGREAMTELKEGEEEAESGMLGLLASVREGAESIAEMREAVMGFGEAMLAVFAFEELKEFVEGLGEAGERVQHTAQAFGMTTEQVQRLQAIFTAAGAGPEALQMAMMRLDRASSEAVSGNKRAADAFSELGVNIAQPMTSAQRMQEVLEGFSKVEGPQRAAVAMAIFGRNVMDIAPLLGITAEQLEEYNAAADRFGAVNAEAVGHMAALGATLNENKVAMTGLQNVLGDALSGAFIAIIKDIDDFIAGCVQSYQSGGLLKQILDTIAVSIEVVGESFRAIAQAVAAAWDAITGQSVVAGQAIKGLEFIIQAFGVGVVTICAGARIAFDELGEGINELESDLRMLAEVAQAAFSLNWSGVTAAWQSNLNRIQQMVDATTKKIRGDMADASAAIGRIMDPPNPSEKSPTAVAGTPPKLGGEKNAKKPKDDIVSQWTEQLRELQDEQSNWYADQNKLASDFWAKIVAGGQGSAKDQQEARDRLAEANKAADSADVDSAISAAGKKASAAKGNVDQVVAIYTDLEAMLRAKHAEGGEDWRKVEDAKTEAVRRATQEQLADQEKVWQEAAKAQQSNIQTQGQVGGLQLQGQDQGVNARESEGLISARQAQAERVQLAAEELALQQETAERIYQSKIEELNKEIAAESANAEKVKQLRQQIADATAANDNRMAVEAQQHANRVAQINQQAAQKVMQDWRTGINGAVSSFTSGMLQMAERGTSFQSVMLNVGNSIASSFLQAIDKMITNWIVQMIFGQAATQASMASSSLGQIESAASIAAANTFAATSAIPVVGPMMAEPAADAAYMEVMAFAATASAAGGYDIPSGTNPVTQLHAEEMVLPASIANPLRGMIAANGNAPGAAGSSAGGDTHNWNISALDSRSVRNYARSGQGRAAARQIAASHR